MSRYVVEQVTDLEDGKKGLTRCMRDPIGVLGSADVVSVDYTESERHRPDSKGSDGYVQGLQVTYPVQETLPNHSLSLVTDNPSLDLLWK
jgi:hypothetical protein